ncbi:MAG: replication-relaxation family protein [bacterium]
MNRRSKCKRKSIPLSKEWYEVFCLPRITERDFEILKFIYENRIVTSYQIAKLFWEGRSNSQGLANRRLRKLYDLHCIDRFFPIKKHGTSCQHLVLDVVGALVLGVNGDFEKLKELPVKYRHSVYTADFIVEARSFGLINEKVNYFLDGVNVDIYYPQYNLVVDIDVGTESISYLIQKATKINQIHNIKHLFFVTNGGKKRIKFFTDNIHTIKRINGCRFNHLNCFLAAFKEKKLI